MPSPPEALLQEGDVGTVVVTMGNTGLGTVDPLSDILALRERYEFRIHADAAYGGYFRLASALDPQTKQAYVDMGKVDSIVIDPHKHGLQPYGCGCIMFSDNSVGRFYKHDSPYTYFSSAELHLGEISLECSRAGAAAVALWATQELLPLKAGGEFAERLDASLGAARQFYDHLQASGKFMTLMPPELDIVVWAAAAADTTTASARAHQIFETAARNDLHLAVIELPVSIAKPWLVDMEVNSETVTCLRSVLMKPEHSDWCTRIVDLLEASAT